MRFFAILLFTALYSLVYSQPTLTKVNTPQSEYTYVYNYASPSNIEHGNNGSNIIWNFQNLQILSDSIEKYYTNDSIFDAFPEHNYPPGYFLNPYNLKSYHYHYLITPERYSIAYELVPIPYGGNQACPVDKTLLEFPFFFNDSIHTTWNCGVIDQAYVFVHADAWGSLTLPEGTYINTLRICTHEKKEYRHEGTPSSPFDTVFIERYEWYDETAEVPLLSIEYYEEHVYEMGNHWFYFDTTVLVFDHAFTTGFYHDASLSIIDLIIYPQPVQNMFFIEFSSKQTCEISMHLTSILGTANFTPQSDIIHKGKNILELYVEDVPSGIYLFEIRHSKGRATAKIIIQH